MGPTGKKSCSIWARYTENLIYSRKKWKNSPFYPYFTLISVVFREYYTPFVYHCYVICTDILTQVFKYF